MVISKVSSSVLTHILVVKKNVNKNKFELLNKLAFDQLFLENV